jgi:hypothetical protein
MDANMVTVKGLVLLSSTLWKKDEEKVSPPVDESK